MINSSLYIILKDLDRKHGQSIVNYDKYVLFQDYLKVL